MSIATLRDRVRQQRDDLPVLYGDIDFDRIPERLALGPDDETDLPPYVKITREELFADADLIDLMATATMLGDVPCDATDPNKLVPQEQCMLCHGPGRIAAIGSVHQR